MPQLQLVWGFARGSRSYYASVAGVNEGLRLKVTNAFISWLQDLPRQPVQAGQELQYKSAVFPGTQLGAHLRDESR